jgi:hypothetical protein
MNFDVERDNFHILVQKVLERPFKRNYEDGVPSV